MNTRKNSTDKDTPDTDFASLTGTIRESAHQIWLAGLGAFAKAQAEGGKVFETLVREGQTMQRRTQAAAEEGLQEAASRFGSLAAGAGSRASGQWGRLETLFEDRVATALGKLGLPSAQELAALRERVDELEMQVRVLARSRQPAAKARPAAARKTVRKPAARAGRGA